MRVSDDDVEMGRLGIVLQSAKEQIKDGSLSDRRARATITKMMGEAEGKD